MKTIEFFSENHIYCNLEDFREMIDEAVMEVPKEHLHDVTFELETRQYDYSDDRYAVLIGTYRRPLTEEEQAEVDATNAARQRNCDNHLRDTVLRNKAKVEKILKESK